MTLDDRFTRGFLSGILGGFASLAWGLTSKLVLHFTTLLYSDFAAILILGRKAHSMFEHLFSQLVVFFFFGLLGVVFAYGVCLFTSKNLLFKGAMWGGVIWFASYAITLLFKVPYLLEIPLRTAVSQLIGGVIWGLATAYLLKFIDNRVKNKTTGDN